MSAVASNGQSGRPDSDSRNASKAASMPLKSTIPGRSTIFSTVRAMARRVGEGLTGFAVECLRPVSVARASVLDLAVPAFVSDGVALLSAEGDVQDSGDVRLTPDSGLAHDVPMPVPRSAVLAVFTSRAHGDCSSGMPAAPANPFGR